MSVWPEPNLRAYGSACSLARATGCNPEDKSMTVQLRPLPLHSRPPGESRSYLDRYGRALLCLVSTGRSVYTASAVRKVHYHQTDDGLLVRCYHQCRHWLSPGFLAGWWIVNTITFPIEHVQWDHIWPFDYVGGWLDHTGHLQMGISYLWVAAFVISIVIGLRYVVKSNGQ